MLLDTKTDPSPEYVTVRQLAEQVNMDRSALHRSLRSKGIGCVRVRGGPDTNFQMISAVPKEAAERFVAERMPSAGLAYTNPPKEKITGGMGMIYALQPDPEARPDYIKIGWTTDPTTRFRDFKTLCPHLVVLQLWSVPGQSFETVALEIAKANAKQVGSELFQADPSQLLEKLNTLFELAGMKATLLQTSEQLAG